MKSYNGTGNDLDNVASVKTDALGNIYVTGLSFNDATQNDFVTIKYDAQGNQTWVASYNFATNNDDEPAALVVDGSCVIVTGSSFGGAMSKMDIATIKYDANGNQLWVSRFNDASNCDEEAKAIAVDAQGNIYVSGVVYDSANIKRDILTLKYNSNGNLLWSNRFNGEGNGDDYVASLAVDNEMNVYVAGTSTGEISGDDYCVIKFDASGEVLWVETFNGLGNYDDEIAQMILDANGNVVVTGRTFSSMVAWDDMTTVKYNRNGIEMWEATYNGTGNDDDAASSLVADSEGNVYVTGTTVLLDIARGIDMVTIKYNSQGTKIWEQIYNGPGNEDDIPHQIVLDADKHLNIIAESSNMERTTLPLISYDRNGILLHTAYHYEFTFAPYIATDNFGNVILSGGDNNADFLTIKHIRIPVFDIRLQNSGTTNSLYAVTFISQNVGWAGGKGGTILKTTNAGLTWERQVVRSKSIHIYSFSFVNDSLGFAVGKKGAILKTTNGGISWVRLKNKTRNWSFNDLTRVRFFNKDTGAVSGLLGTLLRTTNGGTTWEVSYNPDIVMMNDICFLDFQKGFSVGKIGTIMKTTDGGDSWDYIQEGDDTWKNRHLYKVNFSTPQYGVAVGTRGTILITNDSGETWTDFTVFNERGRPKSVISYYQAFPTESNTAYVIGKKGAFEYLQTCLISRNQPTGFDGGLYDLFFITPTNGWAVGKNGMILKFSPRVNKNITNEITQSLIPNEFLLHQNFPNPFNPLTTIRYALTTSSIVSMKVYDILGKEVAILLNNENQEIGSHEIVFDATNLSSGMYIYQIDATNVNDNSQSFSSKKKMMLIK
jgi:photosystem II stability/assembly factor-like uncharacterized protein